MGRNVSCQRRTGGGPRLDSRTIIESKATPASAKRSAVSMSSSVVAWSRWTAIGTEAA